MRKLILIALLAGLSNAFGVSANCNLNQLIANENELELLYYNGIGQGDGFHAKFTELGYRMNSYGMRCNGDIINCLPRIKAKHKKIFASKGLEWNIENIKSEYINAYGEVDACKLAKKNAKMRAVLD